VASDVRLPSENGATPLLLVTEFPRVRLGQPQSRECVSKRARQVNDAPQRVPSWPSCRHRGSAAKRATGPGPAAPRSLLVTVTRWTLSFGVELRLGEPTLPSKLTGRRHYHDYDCSEYYIWCQGASLSLIRELSCTWWDRYPRQGRRPPEENTPQEVVLEIFLELPGLPDRRHDRSTDRHPYRASADSPRTSNANLKPSARQAPQLAARWPPHLFAMSACPSRTTPGTVQRTRSSQFRAVLPVSPKGGCGSRTYGLPTTNGSPSMPTAPPRVKTETSAGCRGWSVPIRSGPLELPTRPVQPQ